MICVDDDNGHSFTMNTRAATTVELPPRAALEDEILRLKRERNAVILAHYYQESEIQDLADVLGDSLALARAAKTADCDVIAFCGVHFMAETAKILNPDKTVILPDLEAGCSLAESCRAEDLQQWKERHPDHAVIAYINCSADVKALADCICTSSNAEKIVQSFPEDQPLLFVPDRNLGSWLIARTGREMKLWPGTCVVHESFSERKLLELMSDRPRATFIAHPECDPAVLAHASFVGSTTALLKHVQSDESTEYIVGTETGILHQMRKAVPSKTLVAAPFEGEESCRCNECPHMKRNSLDKLYLCLRDLTPTLEMSDELIQAALRPLDRMLSIS